MSEGTEELVNSFLIVTKNCFLGEMSEVRIRNGRSEKAEEQRKGDGRVKNGQGTANNGKTERRRKKSKLIIIIRSSWHYLLLLGRTLEALGGGSEGVENSGA